MAITKVTEGVRTLGTGEVLTANMDTDPTNASNLSSGDVPLAQLGNVDTSGITANQDDIALLGFKVAANGSLARYNLVDQSIDAFEDTSGVDASASTNETRDPSKYYSGATSNVSEYLTGSGNWTTPAGVTTAHVLLVAGGGGGAGTYGGGGGAGGIVDHPTFAVSGDVAYVIGTGGAGGAQSTDGTIGVNSTFGTLTALGGGKGGSQAPGGEGGSGGSSGYVATAPAGIQTTDTGISADSRTYGHGYAAGIGGGSGEDYRSAGGGGAAAVGENAATGTQFSGAGGAGYASTIADNSTTVYYGGGGGGAGSGAAPRSDGGAGGVGGGGDGGDDNSSPLYAGDPGTANTGGGGGGGEAASTGTGGAGGSGVLYIRWLTYGDMTLISNAQTAESAPTTGDLVITYTNGAGTATVNTDIKAYISRDGSAYTSAVTLVDQGDTGGHTILTANGVDLSGITSGTSMRWKIETLNQSASKDTRIQAVSLGWS